MNWSSGPRLNIKRVFLRYEDSHVKEHEDPYTGNITSLYWDSPQNTMCSKTPFYRWISISFSCMKMSIFEFHRILFPRSRQQYSCIGLNNGLVLNRRQAIIWTNDGIHYCVTWSGELIGPKTGFAWQCSIIKQVRCTCRQNEHPGQKYGHACFSQWL